MLSSSKHALHFVKLHDVSAVLHYEHAAKNEDQCPLCAILRGKYFQSLEMVIYGSNFCIFFNAWPWITIHPGHTRVLCCLISQRKIEEHQFS